MADPNVNEAADDWRSEEETDRLRDEAFRRLMKMPPKPQEEMKLGKGRRLRAKLTKDEERVSSDR